MKAVACFAMSFFWVLNVFGQVTLSGKIHNTLNEPVPYINVLVYPSFGSVIVAYGISDLHGNYVINVKHTEDSLRIETSAIHYIKQKKVIANRTQELNFILEDDVKSLETFTVWASPIERRGDTLSYLVGSFAQKSDRTLADVLRRLPGIEIESGGRIIYQGLPIQKFYVEGLDLMDSRYAVISNNMPHHSVAAVEVYENHQPVRVLEEKEVSHQASLNIKLKKTISTTGTARLGAGYNPFLWDVNITPMTFNRNLQLLASYQTNNIGKDISAQLKSHAVDNQQRILQLPEISDVLSIQQANTPVDFAPTRYLNNADHLANINLLAKLNNNMQLRTNIHYVNDFQLQQANTAHSIYTSDDTIVFQENMRNTFSNSYLQAALTLSKNMKTIYFENKLSIKTNQSSDLGQLSFNSGVIGQTLEKKSSGIANEFHSIIPLGRKLVDVSSVVSLYNNPQQLIVNPGVFASLFNDGQPYETLLQTHSREGFFTQNSLGVYHYIKGIVITQRAGFAMHKQHMLSAVEVDNARASSDFENNQSTFNAQTYIQTDAQYRKKNLTMRLNLPVVYQNLLIHETNSSQRQSLNRFFFRPRLYAFYKFKRFWEASATLSHTSGFGNVDGIYDAYILKSYRNLSQNSAAVNLSTRNSIGIQVKHSNSITAFFNTASFQYIKGNSNLLYSGMLDGNGASITKTDSIPNSSHYFRLHLKSSKYVPRLRTTFVLQADASQHDGIMRINSKTFDFRSRYYHLNPFLLYQYKHWMNVEYGVKVNYFQNNIAVNRGVYTGMFSQNMNLFVYPKPNQMLNLTLEYYEFRNQMDYFLDFSWRYTITKTKIDIELKGINLLDASKYTTLLAFSNAIKESAYFLNPRRIIISASFRF